MGDLELRFLPKLQTSPEFKLLEKKLNKLSRDGVRCQTCSAEKRCVKMWDEHMCDIPAEKGREGFFYKKRIKKASKKIFILCNAIN